MIRAVGEVQLGEVDAEARHPAQPECDPQWFAPEVAGRENGQHVDQHKQKAVITAIRKKLISCW